MTAHFTVGHLDTLAKPTVIEPAARLMPSQPDVHASYAMPYPVSMSEAESPRSEQLVGRLARDVLDSPHVGSVLGRLLGERSPRAAVDTPPLRQARAALPGEA